MVTMKTLIEGTKYEKRLNKKDTSFFDGNSCIIKGNSYLTYALAQELNYFEIETNSIKNKCKRVIYISSDEIENINFCSNDLRAYDIFGRIMRKAKLSVEFKDVYSEGRQYIQDSVTLDNKFIRQITIIELPEIGSFAYTEHLIKNLIIAIELTTMMEYHIVNQTCSISGCGQESLFYPNICFMHLHSLSKRSMPSIFNDGKITTNDDIRSSRLSIEEILPYIITDYKELDVNAFMTKYINTKCFICKTPHIEIYPPGICGTCINYFNYKIFLSDCKNRIIDIKTTRKDIWKKYLNGNLRGIRANIKRSLKRNKLQNEYLSKKLNGTKDNLYVDSTSFGSREIDLNRVNIQEIFSENNI